MLRLLTQRLAYGVRVHLGGYTPADDAFSLEPGRERLIILTPNGSGTPGGHLTGLNLVEQVKVTMAP